MRKDKFASFPHPLTADLIRKRAQVGAKHATREALQPAGCTAPRKRPYPAYRQYGPRDRADPVRRRPVRPRATQSFQGSGVDTCERISSLGYMTRRKAGAPTSVMGNERVRVAQRQVTSTC